MMRSTWRSVGEAMSWKTPGGTATCRGLANVGGRRFNAMCRRDRSAYRCNTPAAPLSGHPTMLDRMTADTPTPTPTTDDREPSLRNGPT
jgi:hypothetical protein